MSFITSTGMSEIIQKLTQRGGSSYHSVRLQISDIIMRGFSVEVRRGLQSCMVIRDGRDEVLKRICLQ